ncbi:YbaB/EbfC family nucleoid-associated protein [Micromonospora sp. WMMD1102]|uniref:YbaB/EbfC family nucleoid-associated protein n=1 Tax=Micromonospora sp. WMMD1102 TaxID=3016105 RepID=UPI00241523FD|nr:YbaB/EbfC family nucleoid-associated protein [Micromonospora sp. WMMD1102]MDG4789742.1 YbaB/EbfC family nucleoid-associated protein [Micromonospora sp. WMMD1102]
MLDRDPTEAEEWIRSWSAQASARAEATTAMADRVAGVTTTAANLDGTVRVRIASSGVLLGLELDDRTRALSGRDLAAEIMATMRRAQAKLAESVTAAVRETVGVDTETGQAVIASFRQRFPADEPDDDLDGRR